jgi:hypothetical protein
MLMINHCSRLSSKGVPGIAAIGEPADAFLTAPSQKSWAHAAVGCEIAPDMARLLTNLDFSRGEKK